MLTLDMLSPEIYMLSLAPYYDITSTSVTCHA